MKNLLIKLINLLPSITIPKLDGGPYLTRWYVFLRDWVFGNIFIHFFHSSDLDQEDGIYLLHNHPFRWSFSFVLTNGYFEWRRTDDGLYYCRYVKPFSFNFISNKVFHRVELLPGKEDKGVWTIFFTGWRPKNSSWGFWNPITGIYKDYKEQFPKKAVA
jgi:hypothetical protein